MIEINRFGMVKSAVAAETGLPVFDFTKRDNPFFDTDYDSIDLCSAAQLKLLNIHLSNDEKQRITGFLKDYGYRGLVPLYSLTDILKNRL